MKYTEIFEAIKMEYFHLINFEKFICFKHRLWVTERGISNEYPQSIFKCKNKKMYTPVHPFWGIMGYTLHGHIFMVCMK